MSTANPHFNLPTRERIRLLGYDYALPGAYFITICTLGRHATSGSICNGELEPSALGKAVIADLEALPSHYPDCLMLDQVAVMPNHLHAVLFFVRPLNPPPRQELRLPDLSVVVRLFKSGVTYKAKQAGIIAGPEPVFQPRFHDHVIRHEKALDRVRDYVINNPRQWELDRENPKRSGELEFYRWLEAYSKYLKTAIQAEQNIISER